MRATDEKVLVSPEEFIKSLSGPAAFMPITFIEKLALQAKEPTSSWATPRRHPIRPYVCATYVSMRNCSDLCPFKGTPSQRSSCYADASFTRQIVQRLDVFAAGRSTLEVIQFEVALIDRAFPKGVPQDGPVIRGLRRGRDLRLHIAGDVGSVEAVLLLAACARRWRVRGGGTIWCYTHDWRAIPHEAWGDEINVFASVENDEDMVRARKRGYVPARVVDGFRNGSRPFFLPGTSTKIIPCRYETERMPCVECRYCLDRDLRKANVAIGFEMRHEKRVEEPLVKLRVAG